MSYTPQKRYLLFGILLFLWSCGVGRDESHSYNEGDDIVIEEHNEILKEWEVKLWKKVSCYTIRRNGEIASVHLRMNLYKDSTYAIYLQDGILSNDKMTDTLSTVKFCNLSYREQLASIKILSNLCLSKYKATYLNGIEIHAKCLGDMCVTLSMLCDSIMLADKVDFDRALPLAIERTSLRDDINNLFPDYEISFVCDGIGVEKESYVSYKKSHTLTCDYKVQYVYTDISIGVRMKHKCSMIDSIKDSFVITNK